MEICAKCKGCKDKVYPTEYGMICRDCLKELITLLLYMLIGKGEKIEV